MYSTIIQNFIYIDTDFHINSYIFTGYPDHYDINNKKTYFITTIKILSTVV